MIIESLMNLWRDDSVLKEIFSRFDSMLIIAEEMFEKATSVLFNNPENVEERSREIVKLDAKLNALQQNIRRDIVMHITVKGSKDILPCLLLMSLVKDAERLGDYVKNIMEVAEKFTNFEKDSYFDKLKIMTKDICAWFNETRQAFDEIDEDKSKIICEKAFACEKECDRIAWEMMTVKNKVDAVALALIFRFFKRIAAHLGNICTSVVMPLDKLDYYGQR